MLAFEYATKVESDAPPDGGNYGAHYCHCGQSQAQTLGERTLKDLILSADGGPGLADALPMVRG